MAKIKTLSATVLLFVAVAPAFAQDGGAQSRYGWEPSSSVNSEMLGTNSVRRDSEMTEPGDFAVRPVGSQRSLEPHRPSRSRHKQQPRWERWQ
jgi:hypothetical protein